MFTSIGTQVIAPTIRPSQKWWQTILETKVLSNQREGSTYIDEGSNLFPFHGRWGRIFIFFCYFQCVPWYSFRVLIRFSKGSPSSQLVPQGNPITLKFYPIWFAQSLTLMYVTYKGGLYLFLFCNWGSRYMFLLGNVQCFQNIDDGPIF